jgi:transposase
MEASKLHRQTGGSVMNATTKTVVGVDTAKEVFQLHWVDAETGEVHKKQVKRAKFLEHFSNLSPCLIGMEACGGSHHWARRLIEMGHEVMLMPGKMVKAFVSGNKNDAADARAVWLAMQKPEMRTVAVKSEAQQSVLAMHRMREQLIKFRTMQTNGLRGLLGEYGEVMKRGRAAMNECMPAALQRLAERVPGLLIDTLREQWNRVAVLNHEIQQIEARLQAWMKQDEACQAIAKIPGVGLLTATAAVATMGDAKVFKSGREFAAWLGLVPAQTGSGGRVKLLGISKRGDTYLRTLLIHGARSALLCSKEPSEWLQEISKRRPPNVVIVALANKTARTIWAMLAHGSAYDKQHTSTRPA